MPATLVNNTLSSLNAGVTQQYQEGRFDSQVSDMVNCNPSISRGVLRRNPINAVTTLQMGNADMDTIYSYSYDRGTGDEQYLITIDSDSNIKVFNASTGPNAGQLLYDKPDPYLVIPNGAVPRDSFKAITIGDHTFIVNKTKVVAMDPSSTFVAPGYEEMAFYWIKKTTGVIVEQKQTDDGSGNIKSGSKVQGYIYTLNTKEIPGGKDTRPEATAPDHSTSILIAAAMAGEDSNWSSIESYVYTKSMGSNSDWTWSDTFGNNASLGVWKTVDDAKKLPAHLPDVLDGFTVRITGGTSAKSDDYFLQYSKSEYSWSEVPEPGSLTELDPSTMPHVLYRLPSSWDFSTYVNVDGSVLGTKSQWGKRIAGAIDSGLDPSFIGQKISSLFFHKNRLGFLTSDNIILSATAGYGDYFASTVQDVLDSDPIDLAVASTDVNILRHVVAVSGSVIIFSDDTQLALTSSSGPLTPSTASISPLSNYTYNSKAEAISLGTKVYFTNRSGGYSHAHTYQVSDLSDQTTEANPLTLHLPAYLGRDMVKIVGHSVLGLVFFRALDNPKQLIVLNTVAKDESLLQNAFHKWEFDRDIAAIHIINEQLVILFKDKSLCTMTLDVPGDFTTIDYTDKYPDGDRLYESYLNFSEFFVRDKEGKGTVRGRYQLRTMEYTIEEGSHYTSYIYSDDRQLLLDEHTFGTTWSSPSGNWVSTNVWRNSIPTYTRKYIDDDRITIMADSKKVRIEFHSEENSNKGFILSTVNVEGFFTQRSTRK